MSTGSVHAAKGIGRSRGTLAERQTARLTIRFARPVKLIAEVDVTPAGLLSIGALVCGILLSTSVLVATAVRESRR